MEFETLYKQTFAQVRCPARVAVAAQPVPRRRFGWVICFAAPLLLALVDNLGEIAWSYPSADGETVVHTLSQDRLSEILGDLAGGDIKACAQSPGAFQKLWNRTDAWLYGES